MKLNKVQLYQKKRPDQQTCNNLITDSLIHYNTNISHESWWFCEREIHIKKMSYTSQDSNPGPLTPTVQYSTTKLLVLGK